jgi:hypothetical protein
MLSLITEDSRSPSLSACHITHGTHDGVFSVAGKSIASVQRCLASGFSIPDDAEP